MSVILVALLILAAHEAIHWLLLRRAGAHPWLTARAYGLRGVGWGFRPAGIDPVALRVQWIAGPLVEGVGWITGALVLPEWRVMFLLLLALGAIGNSLPGGDLNRAVRWGRA